MSIPLNTCRLYKCTLLISLEFLFYKNHVLNCSERGDLLTVFLKHIHIVIAVSFRPAIYFGMSAKKLTFLNCTELFICEKKCQNFFSLLSVPGFIIFCP